MNKSVKTTLIVTIIIFSISSALVFLGALAKLQHWSIADPLLISGFIGQVVSMLLGGFTLVKYIRTR